MAWTLLADNTSIAQEKPAVVISFTQSAPDSAYWRRYSDQLQTRPFDGTVFEIDPRDADWVDESYWKQQIENARKRNDQGYLVKMYSRPREKGSLSWGGGGSLTMGGETGPWNSARKYSDATFAKALADITAGNKPGQRFTHNLIVAGIQAPTTDWFNDEQWAQRIENFKVIARFAKRAELKGILFDDEQYGEGCVWNYTVLRQRGFTQGKSFEEMREVARRRGRDFAKAICAEYPDMLFLTLHGYGTVAALIEQGLPEYGMDLKVGFFDGVLESSTDEFIYVDGGEIGYGYNTKEQFEHGRKMILEEPIRMGLTKVPDLYRQKVRCGFGIWPDYYGKIDPKNLEGSYFSPGRLQRALHWALSIGDGYVWLWGEGWTTWVDGPEGRAPVEIFQGRSGLPCEYLTAIEASRTSPGNDQSPVNGTTVSLAAHGRNGCIDRPTLTDLLRKSKAVYELPTTGWTFKLDDWVGPNDTEGFKPIEIGRPWSDQGFTGPGKIGWYRIDLKLPVALKDKKLHLYFSDVDGSVWLYMTTPNRGMQGCAWRYIGLEPKSNRQPFALTNAELASYFLRPGEDLTIAIKVESDTGGGIRAPIKILAEE